MKPEQLGEMTKVTRQIAKETLTDAKTFVAAIELHLLNWAPCCSSGRRVSCLVSCVQYHSDSYWDAYKL